MPIFENRIVRGLVISSLICLSLYVLFTTAQWLLNEVIFPFLGPFIIAMLVASLAEPLILLLMRTRMGRGPASILTYLLILIVVSVLSFVVVSQLIQQITNLITNLPDITKSVSDKITSLFGPQSRFFHELAIFYPNTKDITWDQLLKNNSQQITRTIGDALNSIKDAIPSPITVLGQLTSWIAFGFLFLIMTIFISVDRPKILAHLTRFVPRSWRGYLRETREEFGEQGLRYLRTQLLLGLQTSVITIIGLIILGADYPLVIGLFVGFADMLPGVGGSVVLMPWGIWQLITGQPLFGVELIALNFANGFARQAVESRLVAGNLGIHPVTSLVGIIIGFRLFGAAGMILAPVGLILSAIVIKPLTERFAHWVEQR